MRSSDFVDDSTRYARNDKAAMFRMVVMIFLRISGGGIGSFFVRGVEDEPIVFDVVCLQLVTIEFCELMTTFASL